MKVKVCFNNEIHRIELSMTFEELKLRVSKDFISSLPKNYDFGYTNSEGKQLMITNQETLQELLKVEQKNLVIKLFIVPRLVIEEKQEVLIEEKVPEDVPEKEQQIESQTSEDISVKEQQEMIPEEISTKQEQVEQKIPEYKSEEKQPVNDEEDFEVIGGWSFIKESTIQADLKKEIKTVIDKPEPQKPSQNESHNQSRPVHNDAKCYGCSMMPIVGVRYKCSILDEFDLCEECERTKEHPYVLLKIKHPQQPYSHAPKVFQSRVYPNV